MVEKFKQPWLHKPVIEFIFILLPPIFPLACILIFHNYFQQQQEVDLIWWVVLVLLVDVAHVYSTVFRLYWDKNIYDKNRTLLWVIPVAALAVGWILHFIDALLFWRMLAYLAVFHFVRQQYGFMRLYSRKEKFNTWERRIDNISIYNATLYPLLYWHLNLTQKLNWFVSGDFISISFPLLNEVATVVYWSVVGLTVVKELLAFRREKRFNIPKNCILLGTYLSWYFGIVAFKGDLVFTMLNVVAHGIPYMALVWIFGDKSANAKQTFSFNYKGVFIFIGVIFLLAYFEEAIWDILVWKEHTPVFPWLVSMSAIRSPLILSFLVPLLTLPQITHYVLDGFIWKLDKPRT